jgi:hypothetical protein
MRAENEKRLREKEDKLNEKLEAFKLDALTADVRSDN